MATARALAALGIDSAVAPVFEIEATGDPLPDLANVQAFLVTSANGARMLAAATEQRDIPVFAVGASSAGVAQEAGFAHVENAGGDVVALAALIRGRLKPADGTLVHVCGTVTAGDLAGVLTDAGFSVRRAVLYRAHAAEALPDTARSELSGGTLDGVLLYSPRSARIFCQLVVDAGQAQACETLFVACLSAAVAEQAARLPFADIRVAATPDQDSLFAVLGEGG